MIPLPQMAARRKRTDGSTHSNERPVTPEDIALVKELTGQILDAAQAKGIAREKIGQLAGRKSSSTLYGWRNGTNKRPSLLDLNDFARAVGLTVRLVPYDSVDATGNVRLRTITEGAELTPETAEVVRLMERLPEDARQAIRDAALDKNAEMMHANPHEANESQGSPVRGKP